VCGNAAHDARLVEAVDVFENQTLAAHERRIFELCQRGVEFGDE
jgi:hypothetical protein